MKSLAKLVLGGAMLAGAVAATVAPANAGVSVGVNLGVPVAYGYGNPCFRPYYFRPAYCGYPAYGGPIFIDGGWYRGPVNYRYYGGERYFWLHDRWMRDRDDFRRDRDWHDRDGNRGDWHDRDGQDRR